MEYLVNGSGVSLSNSCTCYNGIYCGGGGWCNYKTCTANCTGGFCGMKACGGGGKSTPKRLINK